MDMDTRIAMGTMIRLDRLIEAAKGLKSEDGENAEDDRALVELILDVAGMSQQRFDEIADIIGIGEVTR